MTIRSMTDEEVMREAERYENRAVLRAFAREIVRLREAMRAAQTQPMQHPAQRSGLEILARALDGVKPR